MDILIDWVTQIIIFLLLASIVDLLVPATSMKKYVKLAVGLILILIFLKPVFYLFDMDVRQALEGSMAQVENEQNEIGQTENLMKTQKNEIQASQHAYILEQMAVQLKDVANSSLQQEYQQEITHIDFQFSNEADLTYDNMDEKLNEVTVTLQESEPGEGGVDIVEDVVINTDEPSENETEFDVEGIKQLLHTLWDVEKEKITIIEEGGSS
ncbi:stage III sporulation protein AF [Lentibacillus halodurans]|uniref:Stage III sporulation protein AF n=1 Tax=Lentibacillus halodurans TaxID=237679 RepID=A0A1I0V5Z0_9BACI|nr:stage III sporulation protein AF [Lentibacillus halodurans]SFA71741.1 stage III sporulation protein AF [Lentibacillus halodurans]